MYCIHSTSSNEHFLWNKEFFHSPQSRHVRQKTISINPADQRSRVVERYLLKTWDCAGESLGISRRCKGWH